MTFCAFVVVKCKNSKSFLSYKAHNTGGTDLRFFINSLALSTSYGVFTRSSKRPANFQQP